MLFPELGFPTNPIKGSRGMMIYFADIAAVQEGSRLQLPVIVIIIVPRSRVFH